MRFPCVLWLSRLSESSGEFRRCLEKAKTHFYEGGCFLREMGEIPLPALHSFRCFHAQQCQTILDGIFCRDNQGNFGDLLLFIICQNVLIVVESIETLCHIYNMSGYNGWLIFVTGIYDNRRELI